MLHPVTIIIPLFIKDDEHFDYAKQAIESALANSCYISIWDDTPSEGKSGALAAKLQKLCSTVDERLTWNGDGVNRGVSYARNMAVSYARTDLILPLDCDDKLAPNAVETLVKAYDGTPLYPDIRKFGHEDVAHYRLLDFQCRHLYERVGLASVCVLHTVDQWRAIGGWREDLDYYEDGEYNARLMGTYCGKNLHQPLYLYRQHHFQKTKVRASEAARQVRTVLSIIGEYDMACCGKGRKNTKQGVSNMSQIQVAVNTSVDDLPLKQGDRVLALYVMGKGKGKHYKRGPATNFNYRVEYGGHYYVFHEDSRLEAEDPARSPFIRVVREQQADKGLRQPVKQEEKAPVLEYAPDPADVEEVLEGDEEYEDEDEGTDEEFDDYVDEDELDLVDIINLPWTQFRNYDFTPAEAKELLAMERRGKNRVKFINKLERDSTSS